MSSPEPADSLLAATVRLDYLTGVTGLIRDMESAHEHSHAVALLQEATLRMGVQASIFSSCIPEGETRVSLRTLIACDPALVSERAPTATDDVDPWITYAQRHSEPVRCSDPAICPDAAAAAVALADRFGFRSAVIVPAPSSGRRSRIAVLCLGSSRPGYFDDEGYRTLRVVARGVAMELHEWWLRHLRDELAAATGVTHVDVALLGHELLGHSTKTIARTLGLSTGSVDSRFQRLNIKLCVPSRKAAARVAAEYGLI